MQSFSAAERGRVTSATLLQTPWSGLTGTYSDVLFDISQKVHHSVRRGKEECNVEVVIKYLDVIKSSLKSGNYRRRREKCCAGIWEQSMAAKNREGAGLLYRPTSYIGWWNRFLGSLKVLKILALCKKSQWFHFRFGGLITGSSHIPFVEPNNSKYIPSK